MAPAGLFSWLPSGLNTKQIDRDFPSQPRDVAGGEVVSLLSSRFEAGVGYAHCPIELIAILSVASRLSGSCVLSDHVA